MAEGDDNEDDEDDDEGEDGDDGEEGDEGEDGDRDQSTDPAHQEKSTLDDAQDKEMTDAAPSAEVSAAASPDIEMKDDTEVAKKPIPNPLTLAPPTASFASGSPKIEGSPLKNVVLPSPTKEEPPVLSQSVPALLPQVPAKPEALPQQQDSEMVVEEESTIAEPPSTILGQVPDDFADRDLTQSVPVINESLPPPPPEQVGNIASPKASPKNDTAMDEFPDEAEKVKDEELPDESIPLTRPILTHNESAMTEDSIKPDDSASAIVPLSGSGPPSEAEVRASSVDGVVDADPVVEPEPEDAAKPVGNEEAIDPVSEPAPEVDLLGGIMGQLDREASKEKTPAVVEEAQEVSAPAAEAESVPDAAPQPALEPTLESTSEPVPEPMEVETTGPPAAEPVVESLPELRPEPLPLPEPASAPAAVPEVKPEPIADDTSARVEVSAAVAATETPDVPITDSVKEPESEPAAPDVSEATFEPPSAPAPEPTAEVELKPTSPLQAAEQLAPSETIPEEAPGGGQAPADPAKEVPADAAPEATSEAEPKAE
jgi:hypothetical protein